MSITKRYIYTTHATAIEWNEGERVVTLEIRTRDNTHIERKELRQLHNNISDLLKKMEVVK